MDTVELCQRLREAAKEVSDEGLCGWGNLMAEAAEHLEKLYNPWHPIETAPDDETILLYSEIPGGAGQEMFVGWESLDEWIDDYQIIPTPTHWADLPQPPK